MKRYANASGHSGVSAYAVTPDSIIVRFADGRLYEYNDERPGRAAVIRMKFLAARGRGLSTFISRNVRENFARKL